MTGKPVKCMVWDLDNTLWQGTLAENDNLILNQELVALIKDLDSKGVLHSIASRNDFDPAWKTLESFGLDHFFLHPQIHWQAKSNSLKTIAAALNLGLDSFYFIDDQIFELEEVRSTLPEVRCCSPDQVHQELSEHQAPFPTTITRESRQRRQLYATELQRRSAEQTFNGDNPAFLRSLDLQLTISDLQENDLQRARELTERTSQLRTTGYTYTQDELRALIASPDHRVLQASLTDKFGDYGVIGLCIAERQEQTLLIKLFLLSCRVMNRSIAGPFLQYVKHLADQENLTLGAEFKSNGRNRQMLITYRFAGFQTVSETPQTGIKQLRHQQPKMTLAQNHVTLLTPGNRETAYV